MRFIKIGTATVCIAKLQPGLLRRILTGEKKYEVRSESFNHARLIAYTNLSGKLLDVYSLGEDLPYRRSEDERVRDMADVSEETFNKLFPRSVPLLWVARIRRKVTDQVLISEIRKEAHL
jgi:hypothetical protein